MADKISYAKGNADHVARNGVRFMVDIGFDPNYDPVVQWGTFYGVNDDTHVRQKKILTGYDDKLATISGDSKTVEVTLKVSIDSNGDVHIVTPGTDPDGS